MKAARTVLSGGKSGEKVKQNSHQRITYRNLALNRRELSIIWLSSCKSNCQEKGKEKHDPDEPDPAKRPAHVLTRIFHMDKIKNKMPLKIVLNRIYKQISK